jgi:hypothetical protein
MAWGLQTFNPASIILKLKMLGNNYSIISTKTRAQKFKNRTPDTLGQGAQIPTILQIPFLRVPDHVL